MNEVTALLGIAACLLVVSLLKAPEIDDLVEAQKQETIATANAAAKEAAHKKAVRLHEQGLIGQSNALVWPIAQVPLK